MSGSTNSFLATVFALDTISTDATLNSSTVAASDATSSVGPRRAMLGSPAVSRAALFSSPARSKDGRAAPASPAQQSPSGLRSQAFAARQQHSRRRRDGGAPEAKKRRKKNDTVISDFQTSLSRLTAVLEHSQVYYIKCLKPHPESRAIIDDEFTIMQLHAAGILEVVKLCRYVACMAALPFAVPVPTTRPHALITRRAYLHPIVIFLSLQFAPSSAIPVRRVLEALPAADAAGSWFGSRC